MKTFLILYAALALAVQIVSAQDFIELVRNCYQNHMVRLNECIVQAVKNIQPRMAGGLPEVNIPPLEPLDLGGFNMAQNEGPVRFDANFRNLKVSGLSRADVKYLDVNYDNLTVFVGATLPGLTIRGEYKINGTVFQLPVHGTGPFLALLEGIVFEGFGVMKIIRGQVTELDSMNVNVKIQKFRSKVENLFGGNEVLEQTFTHFIEENSNLVLEQVQPNVISNLDSFLRSVVNAILKHVPADVLTTHPDANKLDKHRARTLRIQAEKRRQ